MEFHRLLRDLAIAACLLAAGASRAAEWTLVKHEGRDYVTAENIASFYGFPTRVVNEREIHLAAGPRSLRGAVGSRELFINNVKFILSHPMVRADDRVLISRMDLSKLIEPALRPSRIAGAENITTVILDPGHGGHDAGARGPWGNEKDYCLDVALRARQMLVAAGYQVKMTRSTDRFVPLHDRTAFANQFPRAVFISIHFNSGYNREASGIETFTLAPRGVPSFAQDGPRVSDFQLCAGNARDPENMVLAMAAHSAMLRRLYLPDRGIKRARFVVIREIKIPGVLLEGGFLSHPSDSRLVATPRYRQEFAQAIAEAVKNYRLAVTGGRTDPGTIVARKTETPSLTVRPGAPDEPSVVIPRSH